MAAPMAIAVSVHTVTDGNVTKGPVVYGNESDSHTATLDKGLTLWGETDVPPIAEMTHLITIVCGVYIETIDIAYTEAENIIRVYSILNQGDVGWDELHNAVGLDNITRNHIAGNALILKMD